MPTSPLRLPDNYQFLEDEYLSSPVAPIEDCDISRNYFKGLDPTSLSCYTFGRDGLLKDNKMIPKSYLDYTSERERLKVEKDKVFSLSGRYISKDYEVYQFFDDLRNYLWHRLIFTAGNTPVH
jgi:hypothetical protein